MKNRLILMNTGKVVCTMPTVNVNPWWFDADLPAHDVELEFTEVRLVSEALGLTVRFICESITLLKGTTGQWTVRRQCGDERHWDLEFDFKAELGEPVHGHMAMAWDRDEEQLVLDMIH